jgi:hypothetical protein
MKGTADISRCGRYRYRLTRRWGRGEPVVFIMLNPSTANGTTNDPTIRRCVDFAQRFGFGGLVVVNLFAYRTAYPRELRASGWLRGPRNERVLRAELAGRTVICAWGGNARGLPWAQEVIAMARISARRVCALALLCDGIPAHPARLPRNCRPIDL